MKVNNGGALAVFMVITGINWDHYFDLAILFYWFFSREKKGDKTEVWNIGSPGSGEHLMEVPLPRAWMRMEGGE